MVLPKAMHDAEKATSKDSFAGDGWLLGCPGQEVRSKGDRINGVMTQPTYKWGYSLGL